MEMLLVTLLVMVMVINFQNYNARIITTTTQPSSNGLLICVLYPSIPDKVKVQGFKDPKKSLSQLFSWKCDTTNIKVFKYFIISLIIITVLQPNITNV